MIEDMDFSKVSEDDKEMIFASCPKTFVSQYEYQFNVLEESYIYNERFKCSVFIGCQNMAEASKDVSFIQICNYGLGTYVDRMPVVIKGELANDICIPFHCKLDNDGLSYLFDFASASKNKDESIDVVINKQHYSICGLKATNSLGAAIQFLVERIAQIISDNRNSNTK